MRVKIMPPALTMSELRTRIDRLAPLVRKRDAAERAGDYRAALEAQRAWEAEVRRACFQAGIPGRVIWYAAQIALAAEDAWRGILKAVGR